MKSRIFKGRFFQHPRNEKIQSLFQIAKDGSLYVETQEKIGEKIEIIGKVRMISQRSTDLILNHC